MLQLIKDSTEKKVFNVQKEKDFNYLSQVLNIAITELKEYPNWYNIGGKLYYFKNIDNSEKLLNELLGPYLAQFYGLESIQCELGYHSTKKETGLLSKSFYKPGKQYLSLKEIAPKNVYGVVDRKNSLLSILELCKTNEEKRRLMLQILNMITIDFYSHQLDRISSNIKFQVSSPISLAPLFDYSETFDSCLEYNQTFEYRYPSNIDYFEINKYICANSLLTIVFPSKEMEDLFNEYPEFYESVRDILHIDIEKWIDLIEMKNDIEFSKSLKDFYLRYDEKKKNFVRKII